MGSEVIIRATQLRIETPRGEYGFSFSFSRHLTVIRGNNSSGKSTLFNALLFSLGMEELVGGKGEGVLPYAVREYFDGVDGKTNVVRSEILTEVENGQGDIVTFRRPIRHDSKSSKLIEICSGATLTAGRPFITSTSTYLHDPGSARRQEGFFYFLEAFLQMQLPRVSTTSGVEAKLYLQAIFAAHAVEQKRGWTDYIANIPFYGIRDARTRVAEYILGLGIFETTSQRNRINAEAVAIDQEWRTIVGELRREASAFGFVAEDLPAQPKVLFDPHQLALSRVSESASTSLAEHINKLLIEHTALRQQIETAPAPNNSKALQEVGAVDQELATLNVLHERATSALLLQRASLAEYQELLEEAKGDLERNKAARKLQELGVNQALELATGFCPTCHQPIADTLLRESSTGPQMDLQTNIAYLESQNRMLQRQIAGLNEGIDRSETTITAISAQLASKRDYATSLRTDLGSNALPSKASIRRQIQIEVEIERLQRLEIMAARYASSLKEIADRFARNESARRNLPPKQYSDEDEIKIALFEKNFRANAGSFGYESVSNIAEIEISRETLVPALAQIELREILTKRPKTDIKADSSASDFVRLIWSYLLGLHQTSANPHTPGNHIGLIMFDEPGQHSMRWESQRELLLRLAAETSLQSIVAASFDESESVFNDVTQGVQHQLITWEGRLIRPLVDD